MSLLAKQRAAEEFFRSHPGQAFDEGLYEELERWGLTQEDATPERVRYVFDHIWERGKAELRVLGMSVNAGCAVATEFIERSIKSGVLVNKEGNPILVLALGLELGERCPVTWFQATDEFNAYVEPITRLLVHEAECYGGEISIYSVCVHPQTERWFKLMGFNPDGWAKSLDTTSLRRFTR